MGLFMIIDMMKQWLMGFQWDFNGISMIFTNDFDREVTIDWFLVG